MPFNVIFNNQTKTYESPISVKEIIGDSREYVCAYVNKRVRELTYRIDKDSEVVPITLAERDAKPIYEASLRFLVAMAFHNVYPYLNIRFSYNVSRSIFVQILNEGIASNVSMVKQILNEMNRLVALDLPLERSIVSKDEAVKVFTNCGELDKTNIFEYRPEKTAHIYTCGEYKNYMYSRMVPSTGYISKFNLLFYYPGLIVQYPRPEAKGAIPPFEDAPTFGKTLKRAHQWAQATGCDTIVGINKWIENYGEIDLITLSEQNHNRQLCELGQMIENDINSIRLICVAGPSSSGKTTFANRLRIELLSRGINPVRISLDDYYKNKNEYPIDENGLYDYESIEALDIDYFNQQMSELISGEEVSLAKFDFKEGKRVKGRLLKLPPNQPIIIEGIHALNERMTAAIPSSQKFKIFISPQAQVNIDNHNPLSITDLRLLRRIVRDYQFRNSSAIETLDMWPGVRKGEFRWIYGNQEGANFVFNSFSPYELCVMRKHALPLLEKISPENEHYPVVERLIRMLKFFKDIPDDWVPCNSIVREFIGGSCYQEDY